ncbi:MULTISPECIES: SDR family oxidoreductase [unclassified Streptomyces]|uniref:SDR family oxidoreductase n=1 Tax=unclassified Streptomyces TaxID=2593676 RepID=UPI002E80A5D4|nr:SDR family oxidoreductase [Streptomyces sp. NBC_00562]WTD31278.1 SDR family oxidoreductase [Streptomyces sp. NBC_01643]WUC17945.1 SDR family oxidoreductase [Streptomyces sp. NBC_00562]
MSKVIFVTGAGRGLGTDIAREALMAGHQVVATGRRPEQVEKSLGGPQDNLLVTGLDVTSLDDAKSAAQAAVGRFGRIDVLVNNAGNFFAGYFEEITPDQMRRQIETNLFGPMNVTRTVLPIMRKQRDGHVITLSSSAGLIGQEFCVAYAASKFGVEGWMESLRYDVEPFNIRTTVVEPGFFRTELLVDASTTWPEPTIDDYAERTRATIEAWKSMNGRQSGDPAKLARALLTIAHQEKPMLRFVAGADAIEGVEAKAKELLAQAQGSRELGGNLAYDAPHS